MVGLGLSDVPKSLNSAVVFIDHMSKLPANDTAPQKEKKNCGLRQFFSSLHNGRHVKPEGDWVRKECFRP